MFEAYRVGIRLSLTNGVSSGLIGIIGQFNTLNNTISGTRRNITALERDIANLKRGALAGGLLAGAGMAGLSLFSAPLQAATEYEKAYTRFKTLNLGDTINREADKFARGARVFGVSSTEMMEGLRSSIGLFNDFDMARKLTPMIAELNKANSMLFGGSVGALDDSGVRSLMKFIDRRGGNADEASFRRNLDLAQRMVTGSGGAIKFSDLANFSQYGGTAFRGLSDDGLLRMSGLLQEQGGARAGTALMSLYQNLIAGRTPKKAMAMLAEYGLGTVGSVDAGIINGKPFRSTALTNIKGAALLQSDPVAWIQSVLLPTLASKGVTGDAAVLKVVNDLVSNRTASGQVSITATQLETVLRDYDVTKRAMGVQGTLEASKNSRAGMLMNYEARMEDLKIELGMTILPLAVKVTKTISTVITSLADFANKYPGFTKAIMYTVGGLSALAVVGGGVILAATGLKALGMALAFAPIGGAAGIGALAGGFAALALKAAALFAVFKAGEFLGDNLIKKPTDWLIQKATGNDNATLGTWLYDVMNPGEADRINPVAPAKKPQAATQGNIYMDGQKVGEIVSERQSMMAWAASSTGTAFDPTRHPSAFAMAGFP